MGGYIINTGGAVKAFSDKGTTKEVTWKETPEKAWQRKEREILERGKAYFGVSSRERALQQILWDQVNGKGIE
jgi:hypothetical protein